MSRIVVDGVPPYDGRYEFDIGGQGFSTREWGWIKRLAGYMPLTLDEGFDGGDPELFTVFAVIALHRAGKIESRDVQHVFERIADAPFGTTIQLETDPVDEDADADPPPPSSNGNENSSGTGSRPSSGTSPATPEPSGTLASGSSGSVSERWAT